MNIFKFVIPCVTSLKDTLIILNEMGEGFLLVGSDDGEILGIIADGDVRRALINGFSLSVSIDQIMNRSFRYWHSEDSMVDALAYLNFSKCRFLPILDRQKRLTNILFSEHPQAPSRENPVVIMAGGLGSRLRPMTNNVPKPMLRVNDKPFLESILENFIDQGFLQFYFCVNYLAEQIIEYFGDGSKWGVRINYVREQSRLGTAGGLALIDGLQDLPVFVMNADLITNLNFVALLECHIKNKNAATMAVRSIEHQVPFGVVQTDCDRILGITEKPIFKYLINTGIYVINPKSFELIPRGDYFDMPSLIEKIISKEDKVGCFPIYEGWIDIGRIEDYQQAISTASNE